MEPTRPVDLTQYQVVASRRQAMDALMWQVPVLSLTAQAFLFSIALGSDSSCLARMLAGSLALFASLASIQLMSKHRLLEVRDSKWLEAFERENGLAVIHSRPPRQEGCSVWKLFVGLSSYRVWVITLFLFALAAVLILVLPSSWTT